MFMIARRRRKNPVLEIRFWKQSASRDDDENARECAKIFHFALLVSKSPLDKLAKYLQIPPNPCLFTLLGLTTLSWSAVYVGRSRTQNIPTSVSALRGRQGAGCAQGWGPPAF